MGILSRVKSITLRTACGAGDDDDDDDDDDEDR